MSNHARVLGSLRILQYYDHICSLLYILSFYSIRLYIRNLIWWQFTVRFSHFHRGLPRERRTTIRYSRTFRTNVNITDLITRQINGESLTWSKMERLMHHAVVVTPCTRRYFYVVQCAVLHVIAQRSAKSVHRPQRFRPYEFSSVPDFRHRRESRSSVRCAHRPCGPIVRRIARKNSVARRITMIKYAPLSHSRASGF